MEDPWVQLLAALGPALGTAAGGAAAGGAAAGAAGGALAGGAAAGGAVGGVANNLLGGISNNPLGGVGGGGGGGGGGVQPVTRTPQAFPEPQVSYPAPIDPYTSGGYARPATGAPPAFGFGPGATESALEVYTPTGGNTYDTLTRGEQRRYVGGWGADGGGYADPTHAANAGPFGWRNMEVGGRTMNQYAGDAADLYSRGVEAISPVTNAVSDALGFADDVLGGFRESNTGQFLGNLSGGLEGGNTNNHTQSQAEKAIAALSPEQLAMLIAALMGNQRGRYGIR